MERLTVGWAENSYDTFDPIDIVDNKYSKINYEKVLTKLGQYEDAEEQGLLLRLPCKVGDTVYYVDDIRNFVDECKVIRIECKSILPDYISTIIELQGKLWHCINASLIGKTVFLTKEEAEQKLASMQKGE